MIYINKPGSEVTDENCLAAHVKSCHGVTNTKGFNEAYKLSESSGLPAITNTLIEENKQRSLASRFVKKPTKQQDAVAPAATTSSQAVDLSDTRIHPVDFNAPGFENKQVNDPAVPHSSFVPKQRVSTSQSDVGTGLVANSPGLEQPPIVP